MRSNSTIHTKNKIYSSVGIRGSFELTISPAVSKRLAPGDLFRAERVGSEIVLRPLGVIEPDQFWFWTSEWQVKEREAAHDIKAGRVSVPFRNVKDFMRGL